MEHAQNEAIFREEALVHFIQIYRSALRMTSKREDAEDLAQDTFLQAWKAFDKYKPGTNCRAWLYQILINKNHAMRRKLCGQSNHVQEIEDFFFESAVSSTPISEDLTDKAAIGAIGELPENFRSVILLIDVYEFKYKEVAEILRVPIGTIMSRLHRARAILRNSLERFAMDKGIIFSRTSV